MKDILTSKIKELVRVVQKVKEPFQKHTVVLMSDGSVWERLTHRAVSGEKIHREWKKLNKVNISTFTEKVFLDIFVRGGWKISKKKDGFHVGS